MPSFPPSLPPFLPSLPRFLPFQLPLPPPLPLPPARPPLLTWPFMLCFSSTTSARKGGKGGREGKVNTVAESKRKTDRTPHQRLPPSLPPSLLTFPVAVASPIAIAPRSAAAVGPPVRALLVLLSNSQGTATQGLRGGGREEGEEEGGGTEGNLHRSCPCSGALLVCWFACWCWCVVGRGRKGAEGGGKGGREG
jgi:hypothetical protein